MSKESVIWGVSGDDPDEQVLLSQLPDGSPIASRATAEKLMTWLANRHGCSRMRIQEIDGCVPDFAGTVAQ